MRTVLTISLSPPSTTTLRRCSSKPGSTNVSWYGAGGGRPDELRGGPAHAEGLDRDALQWLVGGRRRHRPAHRPSHRAGRCAGQRGERPLVPARHERRGDELLASRVLVQDEPGTD